MYNYNNKQTFLINEKPLKTKIAWMIYRTIDCALCVCLSQSSFIPIILLNVIVKSIFHLPKCLLLSLVFCYIYIPHDSVETHLRCSRICNNSSVANSPQSVQWKNFEKRFIIGGDIDKSKVARFYGPRTKHAKLYVKGNWMCWKIKQMKLTVVDS